MADLKSLEHPTLKVPYEILNKKFRAAQKVVDREVSHVTTSLGELDKLVQSGLSGDDVENSATRQGVDSLLASVQEQLAQLKAKGGEALVEELAAARVCKRRVEHLKQSSSTGQQWKKARLDRMLVEYFLRNGFYNTATKLANTSEIEDLTNIEVFLVAREVEEALSRGDVSKCLSWCHDNKSKLRKMKSTLEFNVRLQEFIEMIKKDQKMEAVRHAKKFLSTDDPEHLPIVQQGMALLAFPLDTVLQPYKDLLDHGRWQSLIEQFRSENYRLHQLSSQSMFTVALQAGLSSLKTSHCYKQSPFVLAGLPSLMQELRPRPHDRNPECPVCHPALNTLAIALPFAHCSQSRLVCSMSGKPLNENNVPMMLPNGYVYGEQALNKMAKENDGQIVCPRTKEIYSIKDADKVFVM